MMWEMTDRDNLATRRDAAVGGEADRLGGPLRIDQILPQVLARHGLARGSQARAVGSVLASPVAALADSLAACHALSLPVS